MKKAMTILFLIFAASTTVSAETLPCGEQIIFAFHGIYPGAAGPRKPRAPQTIPQIYLSGHTLYIETAHPGYALFLRNLDGMVVFYGFVPNSQNTIELPSDLSGEYEIELQCASYSLIGEIEL